MKLHYLREAGLYLGLSLVATFIELAAIGELGIKGVFITLPLLFLLFAAAAEYGKKHSNIS